MYEIMFDMFFRIHIFGPWIYGILHLRNFTQLIFVIYFLRTSKNYLSLKDLVYKICYTIECLRNDNIRTILDGGNAEQARNY